MSWFKSKKLFLLEGIETDPHEVQEREPKAYSIYVFVGWATKYSLNKVWIQFEYSLKTEYMECLLSNSKLH